MKVFILSSLVYFIVFLPACKKKEEASCSQISSHFVQLVESELSKKTNPEGIKRTRANLPTLQNALLEACEEQKWTLSTKKCILSAKNAIETKECDPSLSLK